MVRFLCTTRIAALLAIAGLATLCLGLSQIGQKLAMSAFCDDNGCFGRTASRWHAEKFWHDPHTFPACSMDACFDFSRCAAQSTFRIFVYGAPFYPISYFNALLNASNPQLSSWVTRNPSDACVFLLMEPENSTLFSFLPHPRTLRYWNGGLNHVIVSLADKWSETGPPAYSIGKASVMASCLQQTEYRPEFDVSIPLAGKVHLTHLQTLKPSERKYFLTFKGTRYVGDKEGNFRSDPVFRGMHNAQDVVVAVTCKHSTNDKFRKVHPEVGKGCEEDELTYQRYGFTDLMNTAFGLAPAGRSPASYRLIEILSAGAIPVVVADNYVKPFETLIQWHRCLLLFPISEMKRILPALRAMGRAEMERRQRYCLFAYETFLKDDATLLQAVVWSLQLRMYGVLPQMSPPLMPDMLAETLPYSEHR